MLHEYRIEEAAALLADETKAHLPILTIALSVVPEPERIARSTTTARHGASSALNAALIFHSECFGADTFSRSSMNANCT